MKLIFAIISVAATLACSAADFIRADVDASDTSRGLLHAKLVFSARPGPLKLWYPKWIQGVHGPVGPVQNVAGLTFQTGSGKSLKWKRDDLLLYQFVVEVPEGETEVIAKLDYICNQPSVNSTGVDSYANGAMGIVNFNTCLLYPDGADIHELQTQIRFKTPEGWKFGSSLKQEKEEKDWIVFNPTSFEEAVDSPIIFGKHVRKVALRNEAPAVFAHFVSESESAIQIEDKFIDSLKKMVSEAMALFGKPNYPEYHLLVGATDQVPGIGLEHLCSSLNVVNERDLVDEKKRKARVAYLLPHEYSHSWCGKYRRPAGMVAPNYHTDLHTELLWVYEGLDQYLGQVLMVRSGLMNFDDYRQAFPMTLSRLIHTTGRQWRPLEDTAMVSWQLRGRSKSWGLMRRSQDYYNEGLVIWMEIDATIRTLTGNQKSLNDFCKIFFAPQPGKPRVSGYALDEVIETLQKIAPHDWRKLIAARVSEPAEELSLDFLDKIGYRLEYSSKPSDLADDLYKLRKTISALDSLGLEFSEDGKIMEVVPGMAGDKAGLAPGMDVQGVNDRKFSRERFQDALAESATAKKIEFLLLEADRYRRITVPYADGPRSFQLSRKKEKADLLAEIMKPLAK
jgi:predicted metalloprotease with PDZ domain